MARLPNFLVIIRSEKLSGKGQGRGVGVRKKERFVLGKRTFRSQKSKHFVLRIIHPDAEIRMMDLENRTAVDMSALNSPDTDSYHSWSSNSDWVVFSSRRDNGLYTLPYICYIGKDGKPSKPFLLPQEDPDKYDYQLYSYNIPELTKGAVEVSPYEIQQVAEKNKPEQVRFK